MNAPVAANQPRSTPPGVFGPANYGDHLQLDADVLIIGSGAGGGVMAAELAECGRNVVVVEEGLWAQTEDFRPEARKTIQSIYRDGGASMTIGNPPVIFSEGKVVGGSTVLNGGMSWRTPEPILDRWVRDDGVTAGSAKEMEPWFQRVEHFIHTAHQDPESASPDNELLKRGSAVKGWKILNNIRNQVHCAGTNNCAWGCPTGAKQSVLVTYIPRALHFGARVYTGIRVERITFAGTRATGIEGKVVGPRGQRVTIRAKAVIVSCGAIQTPALLLRSGLRSRSGRIGTDLSLHPNTKIMGIFDQDVDGWKGVHQNYQVREFQEDGVVFAAVNVPPGILAMATPAFGHELVEQMNRYNKVLNAGLLLEDETTGRVRLGPGGVPLSLYALTDRDTERLVQATLTLCELLFAAGAKGIAPPFEGAPALHSPDDIKKLRAHKVKKSALELFTVHMMGTARMGNDPKRHVCDPWGKVYGTEGLWVSDASLFPSPIGVNPMETIMALSTRNALRMLETGAGV